MPESALIDRLTALPALRDLARDELAWLAEHGETERLEPGGVISRPGHPIPKLYIVLAGRIAVYRDRGTGAQLVMTWTSGDVTGMLPYSRMKRAGGTAVAEDPTEVLALHERHFPEMVTRCPAFTAHTVHLMLDRARNFSASELQDEKMISLGRLAAGLAHELNNPASAAARSAKLLGEALAEVEAASRELGGVELTPGQLAAVSRVRATCQARAGGDVLSPLAMAERERVLADWLRRHGQDEGLGFPLAETPLPVEELDALAAELPRETFGTVLRWMGAGCTTRALAQEIESTAGRIHDLVAAMKRFSYMDTLPAAGATELGPGLRDTVRIVASKAKGKGASIELAIDPDLPPVPAPGSELNQVWLNLIDNALDAVPQSGHVRIEAKHVRDRVIVSIIDDGPGIPEEILPRIFDAFFTTKAPGQGTGLGLELTRRIVRRHRGDLTVESAPGRTEFRVSLTAAPAPTSG